MIRFDDIIYLVQMFITHYANDVNRKVTLCYKYGYK